MGKISQSIYNNIVTAYNPSEVFTARVMQPCSLARQAVETLAEYRVERAGISGERGVPSSVFVYAENNRPRKGLDYISYTEHNIKIIRRWVFGKTGK